MAVQRKLPEHRNPLLEEERAPAYEILVERRCLGQTELKVKPSQVGTSSATKPDNLGVLDYAHLRVPLPKDLSSSGIFSRGANKKYPEAYFLMRRSSDGFISATGMFKAAFPYAQVEDEVAEKEYIKTLSGTSSEEVAGNVWIDPEQALVLADEYGIREWIDALLDPEPITHGTDSFKTIRSPPTFHHREADTNGAPSRSPTSEKKPGRRSTRERSLRSVSPSKKATGTERSLRSVSPSKKAVSTPARKLATPKSRRIRTRGASASVEPEAVNGETSTTTNTTTTRSERYERHDTVRVEVESFTQPATITEEDEEVTKVSIELPKGEPAIPIPEDPAALMAEARRMVAESTKHDGPSSASRSKGKRKVEEMIADSDDEGSLDGPDSRSKRVRTELETRRERLRRRAMVGIGATLAVGTMVPVITGLMPVFGNLVMTAFGS